MLPWLGDWAQPTPHSLGWHRRHLDALKATSTIQNSESPNETMKTYEHHPKVLTNNKFYVIMLEYPWFKQSKGLLPKNGHPSVIPLFMEILKLGVHIPIGLMIICNSEWNNLKAHLPVSWSIWHHMAFWDPPLRGCSKRCIGTGPGDLLNQSDPSNCEYRVTAGGCSRRSSNFNLTKHHVASFSGAVFNHLQKNIYGA